MVWDKIFTGSEFMDLFHRCARGEVDEKPKEERFCNSAVTVYVSSNATQLDKIVVDSTLPLADVLPTIGKLLEFVLISVEETPELIYESISI